MKPLSFIPAVCLPVFLFLSVPIFAEDTPARTIPPLTLEEQITDLLETIQDEAPDVYRRMADLPREEALARIMRALDSGVVPAAGADRGRTSTSSAGQSGRVRNYPALELTGKKILYLKFDSLTQETAPDAVKAIGGQDGRQDAPDAPGLIFDLRNTSGGDYACAESVAEAARKRACPVMVLVSGGTNGPGELLAAFLRRDCGAVLLGTETAGCVFPVKRIYVNDTAWFLPHLEPEFFGISPYALKPDLEKSSGARLTYDQLKESPDKLDGDPVLRLAADLLTMRAAVKPVEQAPAL
jgi:hypothetical protein